MSDNRERKDTKSRKDTESRLSVNLATADDATGDSAMIMTMMPSEE